MSKKMAGIIMLYGMVLGGLALGVKMVVPEGEMEVIWTVMAGGALCVFWGVLAWAGHRERFGVGLTGVALAIVLLHGTVEAWRGGFAGTDHVMTLRLLFTGMLVLTVGLLMYVLHGERTDEFYMTSTARPSDVKAQRNPRG